MSRKRLFALAALFTAGSALAATNPSDQASKRWKQADACIADANKQVPDHNEAALKRRDQLTNDCMVAHKLPPLTNAAPADATPPVTPPKSN